MSLPAVGFAATEAEDYEVNLSWFIDLEQFGKSAHKELSCIQCHQSVKDSTRHPDPANVTKTADAFFEKRQCAGSDCHENTLEDFEKGAHGRIQFENREKYSNCIDCHDPHLVRLEQPINGTGRIAKKERRRCLSCEKENGIPIGSRDDEQCLECHSVPAGEDQAVELESRLCFECHDQAGEHAKNPDFSHLPLIEPAAYHGTVHADNRCTDCHQTSATYGHENQVKDCVQCHKPHHESENHDAHVGIECKACHLEGEIEVDRDLARILWQPRYPKAVPAVVHQLVDVENEENCARCHAEGNDMGAANMVLPAKGVICISCHTATFSVNDPTTLITLILSLLAAMGLLSLWLTAGPAAEPGKESSKRLRGLVGSFFAVVFSRRILGVIKAVFLDAIIQRKLFVQSKWRWFSHGLIFYPFLLRFGWGLVSLILSLVAPECGVTAALLNKNQPLVAFVFDATGVLIILGVVLMMLRKLVVRKSKWPGVPRQEWFSFVLIGGVIVGGFVLEGLRIAMTLDLADKQYAFLGYAISGLFVDFKGATRLYGYGWYLHALLTAAFVVWLPFSRLFHIVMGPLVIAVHAAQKHEE